MNDQKTSFLFLHDPSAETPADTQTAPAAEVQTPPPAAPAGPSLQDLEAQVQRQRAETASRLAASALPREVSVPPVPQAPPPAPHDETRILREQLAAQQAQLAEVTRAQREASLNAYRFQVITWYMQTYGVDIPVDFLNSDTPAGIDAQAKKIHEEFARVAATAEARARAAFAADQAARQTPAAAPASATTAAAPVAAPPPAPIAAPAPQVSGLPTHISPGSPETAPTAPDANALSNTDRVQLTSFAGVESGLYAQNRANIHQALSESAGIQPTSSGLMPGTLQHQPPPGRHYPQPVPGAINPGGVPASPPLSQPSYPTAPPIPEQQYAGTSMQPTFNRIPASPAQTGVTMRNGQPVPRNPDGSINFAALTRP